ncbi:MAG: S24 family peptidase [Planctomycetaceae bacterium]|nr:S24 family peptidase [Planctomycetaceae bacterium]
MKRFNATSLGKEVGVPSSSAAHYWHGRRAWPMETLPRLAGLFGCNVDFLLTGENLAITTRDRRLEFDAGPTPLQSPVRIDRPDQVEVAEIDLRYGLGATYLDDNPDAAPRTFSRAWLRNFTDSPPDQLFWARGQGNSMEPEIREGDIVLIDRRQQSPHMADLIWAFAYGETGMIKWLRPMPDGSVKIMSSNQSVRPEVAHDGELSIIGRVVAVVKKL